ncbi:MAG: hypothetical protein A2808_01020 [Candidatus Moranbacteria bacterium RIFCSPHIGHO2_01_FULL_55_24]|nr:MAG: hypothetical protein A2808_01020 [Candidatus Moranbacteria bacterium RIFCSPHIGHO2_01_FULL_55_24]
MLRDQNRIRNFPGFVTNLDLERCEEIHGAFFLKKSLLTLRMDLRCRTSVFSEDYNELDKSDKKCFYVVSGYKIQTPIFRRMFFTREEFIMCFNVLKTLIFSMDRLLYYPPIEEEIEWNMERLYRFQQPETITEEDVVNKVLRGWARPVMIKNCGRLISVSSEQGEGSRMIFKDGKLLRESSPEELRKQVEAFEQRMTRDTPKLRQEFEHAVIDGKRVVEVGDMVWWQNTDHTQLLAACRLEDGSFLVLGYDDGTFVIPKPSRHSWVLSGLEVLPKLELDDGKINIHFGEEHYLMAAYSYDENDGRHKWMYVGTGYSGDAALEAFAKHGMSFHAESDE